MQARSAAVVLALTGWPGALATAQVLPLSPEVAVNTYTTGHQRASAVASDAAGNFVVVWQSFGQDGNNDGVFGRRFDASGVPRGPEFRVNTYTTGNQSTPDVASDPAGNFVVAWTGVIHPALGTDIFVQRYDSSGAPQGVNTVVNTYTTGAQQSGVVSMDDFGRFVVAWTSDDGDQSGILFRAFDAVGGPLSPAIRANVYTTDFQAFPAIAQNGSADFVVTWQSAGEDGNGLGMFARLFPAGLPSSAQFRANSYTTGDQPRPSVAVAPAGEFLVAWYSDGQDGSSAACSPRPSMPRARGSVRSGWSTRSPPSISGYPRSAPTIRAGSSRSGRTTRSPRSPASTAGGSTWRARRWIPSSTSTPTRPTARPSPRYRPAPAERSSWPGRATARTGAATASSRAAWAPT